MSYYRDIIQQHTKMISMSFEEITYAHNKNAMREYARAAGVRTPVLKRPIRSRAPTSCWKRSNIQW
jgi:hypothetical protein